ncbi:MAG: S1/P1 nuclease [Thermoanaerobaculia bacterium]|nr:S1/P1 nuclease [Thermoanaerobaculia bacterium]MCZ7651624.1 S1/P1 nuclease [Thermoanaerobaculia bacterium]
MPRASHAPVAAVLLSAALAAPLAAWGPTGHRAVGLLAERQLSEAARAGVAELIGPDSLAEVSNWADEIKSDPAWKHADPWHYVTIPDGQTYAEAEKNPGGDLVEAIDRFAAVLADRARPVGERRQALLFLVHFVADLHQPLHVGGGGDRGGNWEVVGFFGELTNLHSVWDSGMIDSSSLSYTELAGFVDPPTPEQVATWRTGTTVDWAHEAMPLRAQVYDIGDQRLGFAYRWRNWPVVEEQLAKAAARLAGLLERLLAAP